MEKQFLCVQVLSRVAITLAVICSSAAQAEKTLTIKSPAGEKTLTVSEDPSVVMKYTSNGLLLEFENLAITTVCIEDPSSTGGFCRLQAYDASIVEPPEPVVGVPGPPVNVTATASDEAAVVSWTAPNDDGGADITGYRIQVADQGAVSFETLVQNTGTAATSKQLTGLTNDQTIRFRVAAINSEGVGYYSGASNDVTPTGGEDPPPPATGYASACQDTANNVDCQKLFNGDFLSQGLEYVDIRSGTILSIPFIVPDGAATGALKLFSFTDDTGSDFYAWYSKTAGQTDYPDTRSNCEEIRGSANGRIYYTTEGTNLACDLDGLTLVYANFKYVRLSDGALRPYSSLTIEIIRP